MGNPEPSRLSRSLSEDDIEYLKRQVTLDNRIVTILRELVKDGENNISSPSPKDDNWLVRRAYADGQSAELSWLDKILNWRS